MARPRPPALKPPDDDLRASNMKLLETGNFADAELICGGKTFKIHKAVEATSGKVNIEEQNPDAIEVLLKYLYGGAVNMAEETSNRPVIRFCVDLYRAADFLLVNPMLPIVQRRLGNYCDEKLKWLCTRGRNLNTETLLWTKDLIQGIEEAYRWNIETIKKILMEFVWAGRIQLLGGSGADIQDDLVSTPAFIKDIFRQSATIRSKEGAVWTPSTTSVVLNSLRPAFCARCNANVAIGSDNPGGHGQVWDPFTFASDNRILREWCKECAAMDMIPWR